MVSLETWKAIAIAITAYKTRNVYTLLIWSIFWYMHVLGGRNYMLLCNFKAYQAIKFYWKDIIIGIHDIQHGILLWCYCFLLYCFLRILTFIKYNIWFSLVRLPLSIAVFTIHFTIAEIFRVILGKFTFYHFKNTNQILGPTCFSFLSMSRLIGLSWIWW